MNLRTFAGNCVLALIVLANAAPVHGVVVINQITNIMNTGAGFGKVNVFGNPPIAVNDMASLNGNNFVVYTEIAGGNNGAGLSVPISNGENGITSTNGGANLDIDNTEPVNPVFTTIGNSSGKLENGNAIRMSLWMRQDPNSPVTKEPNVEPVLKIELWKEALSGFADFNAVAFPGSGDRVWDTDQNASNGAFVGHNQSQASWADVNNNGTIANGRPSAGSVVTNEWRRFETSLVVDDDPLDDGFGWSIGSDFFKAKDIEEIRSVMFVGDFGRTDALTGGGSFWVDNLMVEVFKDQATMLATPNPNTIPTEGTPGDYNGNGIVDTADYVVWRDNVGLTTALPNDPTGGTIGAAQYTTWKSNFGMPGPGAGVGSGAAVPEPAAYGLVLAAGMMGGVYGARVRRLSRR